ncbi:MAG: hypothetical protein ACFFF9_13235 [Candidatus Thorarchaeota archaeon]
MSADKDGSRRNIGIVVAVFLFAIWIFEVYVFEQLEIDPLLYWVLYFGSFAIHAFLFIGVLFWAGVIKREVSLDYSKI